MRIDNHRARWVLVVGLFLGLVPAAAHVTAQETGMTWRQMLDGRD